jgi:hypothetical protein
MLLHGSALVIVVAIDQVVAFARRVEVLTRDPEGVEARRRFDAVVDVEALRDLIAHHDSYAVGEGHRQTGSRFRRIRLHRVGTTTRVKPSILSMRTLSPVSAPSSQRAAQSSPLTRTCPLGWHGTTTSATCPIIASPPVCGRHRRASRRPQVSSTTSIPRPARTTIRFHGQGAKNNARTIARSSAIRES